MAISINYRSVLAASVAANLSAEQVRTKFRPGGKENMAKAMKEIVDELKGTNNPVAQAVVNMAQAIVAPPATVEKAAIALPWWQVGQAQAIAEVAPPAMRVQQTAVPVKEYQGQVEFIKNDPQPLTKQPVKTAKNNSQAVSQVVSLDDEESILEGQTAATEKTAVEVVPQFANDRGIFHVMLIEDDKGKNYQLQCLFNGHWNTVMSTRMYFMRMNAINIFNRASQAFATAKSNCQFTCKLGEKPMTFFWMPKADNPRVVLAKKGTNKKGEAVNVPGKHFISYKQATGYFKSVMEQFEAIECCKQSIA